MRASYGFGSLAEALTARLLSWLSPTHLEVDVAYGMARDDRAFQSMLDGSAGTPFKRKGHHSVYRFHMPTGLCYLKHTSYQAPRSILRHLLRGRRAHTDSGWEYLAARALQASGLSVADPVAFGEQRWLGLWPRFGFLLSREVPGVELQELLDSHGDPALRGEAFCALGYYMGGLHGSGFFHPARVHDFIVDMQGDAHGRHLRLTMIDLDFKGGLPVPAAFASERAIQAVAQACYIFLRVGQRSTKAELRRFLRGYAAGLRERGQTLAPRYLRRLSQEVEQRLAALAASPAQQALFPDAPASLAEAFAQDHGTTSNISSSGSSMTVRPAAMSCA